MKHMKTIEAIALGSALVVSMSSTFLPLEVMAATACNNSTDGKGSTITGNATSFVKTSFVPRCSPNTFVKYLDSGDQFAAKGTSAKGNVIYGSTTEGGGGAVWCGSSTLSAAITTIGGLSDPASANDGCS